MRFFRRRSNKPKKALHTRILIGLLAGGSVGTSLNLLVADWPEVQRRFEFVLGTFVEPLGQVFLRMLFMIVVPLVFTSLALGVASLGDLSRLGRIGARTLLCFLFFTCCATTLGLVLVDVAKPGVRLDPSVREELIATYGKEVAAVSGPAFGVENLVQIIPRNPIEAASRGDMLAVIFVALICGVALTRLSIEDARPVTAVLRGIGRITEVVIDFAMRLAPYGVFALILNVTGRFGWGILKQLLFYVIVALVGMILFQFGFYAVIVKFLSGISPRDFFRKIRSVMITAFSTSSSSATLPTSMRVAETELNVPEEISGFVLPLGATMNMNGTALFEGVTVMFLAQVWGIHLGVLEQILVMFLAVLTAIGTAGVPGGSIPLIVMILQTFGIPAEGIGLILGVDRILDMSRTVLNVTGDITTATIITRLEPINSKNSPGEAVDLRDDRADTLAG
ncbi:MAG TPA: dicarboxylate/amino acid:cation symporter [Acidobacteriota bacterium]|nr:dicarboxylate/amino acid:cation symporter [Acidobacteriota bacterium]